MKSFLEKIGLDMSKKEFWKKFFVMMIGDLLIAFAIVFILKPNQMLSGGINGIAIILEHITSIELGLTVFVLNLPLLIIGWFLLDKKFMLFTLISVFLLSIFISLLNTMKPEGTQVTNNIILACVYGGIVNGVGSGLNFRNGTSTGGLDIVGAIFKKYYNIQMGHILMICNIFIIGSSTFIFSLEKGLFTLIALYITYTVMDEIQMGVGRQKQVFIMSPYYKEITKLIQENITRGVTYISGEGAYENKKLEIIYVICSPRELVEVKNIVKSIDKKAFLAVSDTAEIMGGGFRKMEF